MRILVTGISGFIGNELLSVLAADNTNAVFGVTRRWSAADVTSKSMITADLAKNGWTKALPERIDVVVHLAQSRFFRSFPTNAEDVVRVNIDSTFELLEWTRRAGASAFVFASTGSVYRPVPRKVSEDDQIAPASFYAASKIAAESLCAAYGGIFATTVLRLFSVYGPGASDSVLPRLMRRVINGESIELDGGIGMLTTPTFITDCIDAIVRSMSPWPEPKMARVVNVCGDEEISLREVCDVLGEMVGREPHLLANERIPLRLSGANAVAKQLLGWQPRYSLRAGLAALIEQA